MSKDEIEWKVHETIGTGIMNAQAVQQAAKHIEQTIKDILGAHASVQNITLNGDQIEVDMVVQPIQPADHITIEIPMPDPSLEGLESDPQPQYLDIGPIQIMDADYGLSADEIVSAQQMTEPGSLMFWEPSRVTEPADKVSQEPRKAKVIIPQDRWKAIIKEIQDETDYESDKGS